MRYQSTLVCEVSAQTPNVLFVRRDVFVDRIDPMAERRLSSALSSEPTTIGLARDVALIDGRTSELLITYVVVVDVIRCLIPPPPFFFFDIVCVFFSTVYNQFDKQNLQQFARRGVSSARRRYADLPCHVATGKRQCRCVAASHCRQAVRVRQNETTLLYCLRLHITHAYAQHRYSANGNHGLSNDYGVVVTAPNNGASSSNKQVRSYRQTNTN